MRVPLSPLRCLYRAMDSFGTSTGVVSGNSQFTYHEFGERCQRLASGLSKAGIERGDRVGYFSLNTNQLLEGYFGVVQAGAIIMPLNVRLTAAEIAGILDHSRPRILLFENDFRPLIEKLKPACPYVQRWAALDSPGSAAELTYEELLDSGVPQRADMAAVDEDSIAELFYTSGTTGAPKGVMLSHRTLYLHALSVATLYRDSQTAVELHTIPLFHANGWGKPQAATMLGIKQVMVRRFDPVTVFRLIEEHRATHMNLVPVMAQALMNAPESSQFDLSSMREIALGGAASSPELIARLEQCFHCDAYSGYGLTETAPVLTLARDKRGVVFGSDEERWRRRSMTGWAVPGVEVRVVDENLASVPRDMRTMGEVVASGDHIMDGYYRDPAETAAAMQGGWFHTGDIALWDETGCIQIVDRKKEIIISGGENISSVEVENAILAAPGVLECAVVAAPDEKWGEVPVAIVVRKPDSQITSDEVLAFVSKRLAKFKLPQQIEFRSEPLAKTGTGKIKKLELREQFWLGRDRRVQGS